VNGVGQSASDPLGEAADRLGSFGRGALIASTLIEALAGYGDVISRTRNREAGAGRKGPAGPQPIARDGGEHPDDIVVSAPGDHAEYRSLSPDTTGTSR
jgi:hypothetical protein